jgi:hypothetical protein
MRLTTLQTGVTMKPILCAAIVLTALASVTGSAAACGTGVLRFSDAFDTLNSDVWGNSNKAMSVKAGQMVLTQSNGNSSKAIATTGNAVGRFRNVDYCANVVLNDSPDLPSTYGGLLFWAKDSDHFYDFSITLDGYAGVFKYDGDWTTLIDDTSSDAIKKGKGAVNELRVVTHSGTATFYINGQMFDTITEKTSPGTSYVGLVAESPDKGTATFSFDNAAVRDPVFGGN